MVWPLVKEALVKIGFAVVSYAALSTAIHYALDLAKSTFAGADARVLAFVTMAGTFEACSIVGGAILAAVAFNGVKKLRFVGA